MLFNGFGVYYQDISLRSLVVLPILWSLRTALLLFEIYLRNMLFHLHWIQDKAISFLCLSIPIN